MNKKTGVTVPLSALYTKECSPIGDFPALKDFADFCVKSGIQVIQLLPVNDTGTHSSPYSGLSAFALHPIYIRISALPEFKEAFENNRTFSAAYKRFLKQFKYSSRFDYTKILEAKNELLHLLYNHIEKKLNSSVKPVKGNVNVVSAGGGSSESEKFFLLTERFARANKWVIPYAVFKNLKDIANQASWKSWEKNLANLSAEEIKLRWNNKVLKSSHNFFVWCQIRAAEQFKEAADYVKEKGIVLKGDIPILMNEDSVDCWCHPEYFNQELRAGSPPDGENPLGQNWGFPTYNWENLEKDGFSWWKERVENAAQYYSAFRIDHILGFFRIWAVNQKETTAFLGRTIPYSSVSRKTLEEAGFDKGRIHWLSSPHIPTSLVEDITWNHEEAVAALEKVCCRLGTEELWNFNEEITSDNQIFQVKFFDDAEKNHRVAECLAKKWRDRSLIQLSEDEFIPVYAYEASTSWSTLNEKEKSLFREIVSLNTEKENLIWKNHALKVLEPVVNATQMIPCAEDLGVSLECMNDVLNQLKILSLKVIRWNRLWQEENQPYWPLEKYPELSVATTSVHDSSTLRQWWNEEKLSVREFLKLFTEEELELLAKKSSAQTSGEELDLQVETERLYEKSFSPELAFAVLKKSAECTSAWFVNPLQDYLYLDAKYYLENQNDERINVPGSVNSFNWTYRIPSAIEDLQKNETLVEKIKTISAIHNLEK